MILGWNITRTFLVHIRIWVTGDVNEGGIFMESAGKRQSAASHNAWCSSDAKRSAIDYALLCSFLSLNFLTICLFHVYHDKKIILRTWELYKDLPISEVHILRASPQLPDFITVCLTTLNLFMFINVSDFKTITNNHV